MGCEDSGKDCVEVLMGVVGDNKKDFRVRNAAI